MQHYVTFICDPTIILYSSFISTHSYSVQAMHGEKLEVASDEALALRRRSARAALRAQASPYFHPGKIWEN